ncbi:Thiamine pyrophosphokinase 1 [Hondaea fermentalgiana]|uniref:Thiamine pyrophosphokinase 1 n=1 Tax=Hondaea fermentalgiana TaxID=2315210 RepID=A0A2R5GCQ1_9STRA|nr:Thiamine pyrophosphokinase 1 [Hondaea fermentalgiana]|eukprot:GBG28746.1 Thiamine pyrophosphokinase 1 [Hondaea fermentalgiana]
MLGGTAPATGARLRDLAGLLRGAQGAHASSSSNSTSGPAPQKEAQLGQELQEAQQGQQGLEQKKEGEAREDANGQAQPVKLVLVMADGPDALQPDFMEHLWDLAELRVCVDGAANALYEACQSTDKLAAARFTPNFIVGDLDSIESQSRSFFEARGTRVIQAPDQDKHDLEKALAIIAEAQEEAMLDTRYSVIVLGATGGRLDHEFANISMLFKFDKTFQDLILLSDQSLALLLAPGKHTLIRPEDIISPTCGLAPLAGPARVTTSGLRWNLSNQVLELGGLVSSSNEMDGCTASIETDAPLLWSSVPLDVADDADATD